MKVAETSLLLFAVIGLWVHTSAQRNNTELDVENHKVVKRLTKRQAAPNTVCDTKKEGQVHPIPANGDLVWICRSGEWIPFELVPSTGTSSSLPGKSCKHIRDTVANRCSQSPQSGQYWVKIADSCSGEEQTMEIYCEMTTRGGGWSMVWKHSYMEVSPLTTDMYFFSSHYKPCTDLGVGWCNVPNKRRLQAEEMMIAAYHKGTLVYAYKSKYNFNIDHNWPGAALFKPVTKVVDRCTRGGTGIPEPVGYGDLGGIVINKQVDANTDSIRGTLASPQDDRWKECWLPSSISSSRTNTQMTVAIYVR